MQYESAEYRSDRASIPDLVNIVFDNNALHHRAKADVKVEQQCRPSSPFNPGSRVLRRYDVAGWMSKEWCKQPTGNETWASTPRCNGLRTGKQIDPIDGGRSTWRSGHLLFGPPVIRATCYSGLNCEQTTMSHPRARREGVAAANAPDFIVGDPDVAQDRVIEAEQLAAQ